MAEAKSTSVAVGDACHSEESTASLCLCWRLSSSLAVDREASIRLEGSVGHLFLEADSSVNRRLLSPTVGLSLDLEGTTPTCCCGRAGGVEGVSLNGLA